MQSAKGAINVTTAGDDNSIGETCEDSHQQLSIFPGESEHVNHDLRSKLLELSDELKEIMAIPRNVGNIRRQAGICFAPMEYGDLVTLLDQFTHNVWASQARSTQDQELHTEYSSWIWLWDRRANGLRYPLVISTGSIRRAGSRERRFDGANFKPRKLPENAQTPTSPP
jgi:hypothetical protein